MYRRRQLGVAGDSTRLTHPITPIGLLFRYTPNALDTPVVHDVGVGFVNVASDSLEPM